MNEYRTGLCRWIHKFRRQEEESVFVHSFSSFVDGLFSRLAAPLALFGVVLLSYGLWIPWMGLFGNDLPYLWYYHRLGPSGPGEFASIARPFSAVFYAARTFLFGQT